MVVIAAELSETPQGQEKENPETRCPSVSLLHDNLVEVGIAAGHKQALHSLYYRNLPTL